MSSGELDTYGEQGFVVLRGVVTEAARRAIVEAMEGAVERVASAWRDEGLITETFADLPFATRWAALRQQVPPRMAVSWRRILVCRGIYELWRDEQILGRARSVIGDEVYAHGIWNGRPREPGTADIQRVDWHQDAHYYKSWDPDDGKLLSCWMPLVPVDERSGCLQFLPGSQRRGRLERIQGPNKLFTIPEGDIDAAGTVSVPVDPGDLILFSDTTVHRALDNVSDYVRWSFDIRFGEPTEGIVAKSPTGYRCFSASDPSLVEPYETWAARHEYTYEELLAQLETRVSSSAPVSAAAAARNLGISRVELDAF